MNRRTFIATCASTVVGVFAGARLDRPTFREQVAAAFDVPLELIGPECETYGAAFERSLLAFAEAFFGPLQEWQRRVIAAFEATGSPGALVFDRRLPGLDRRFELLGMQVGGFVIDELDELGDLDLVLLDAKKGKR